MKKKQINLVLIILLTSLTALSIQLVPPTSFSVLASVEKHSVDSLVVTSAADDGPGTLRQALIDAQPGDTITFDPTVFPPTAPVTISGLRTFYRPTFRGARPVL